MKIAIIYFTSNGKNVTKRVSELLADNSSQENVSSDVNGESLCRADGINQEIFDIQIVCKWKADQEYVELPLSVLTGQLFEKKDALIFVGAVGIAVRSIAPFINHKYKDPAVLVIDELGKYCIPILSGHVGGANELAREIVDLFTRSSAESSGNVCDAEGYQGDDFPVIGEKMIPVITTATDLSGKWAVDVFAVKNHLTITDPKKAKEISSKILSGERILLYVEEGFADHININLGFAEENPNKMDQRNTKGTSDFDAQKMPNGIIRTSDILKADIYIGIRTSLNNQEALVLVPKCLVLGIGCKKDTDSVKIEQAIKSVFDKERLNLLGIRLLCSIDLKSKEKGIHDFCEKYQIPCKFYSKEQLLKVPGTFTGSEFVRSITGVENVCERSAMCGAREMVAPTEDLEADARLLVKKQACNGVTIAVGMDGRIRF